MKSVSQTVDKALEGVPIPDEVYLPPAVTDGKIKIKGTPEGRVLLPDDIRDRIQKECDPVGQLMAIANGLPVASFVINAVGKTEVKFETANLNTRIKVLEAMRDKVVPNMSMNHKPKVKDEQESDWDDLTRRRSAQVLAGESDRGG